MESKLKECFEDMVVYKDLKKSNFFSSLGLPSFLRDWVLKKFEDDDGDYDIEEVTDFVKTYLPKKEKWISIKNRIIYENERVKILTKVGIDIDIKTGEITFSLPNFGLTNKETIIEPSVWERYKDELTNGQETWGVIELGYRLPDDTVKPKITGKIKMTGFTNFCPYVAELDYYKDVRSEFNISEWIDILLGAIDYNASGYKNDDEKLTMLTRLLPFLEKRLNLLELAPKGTGKSYVFGNLSKYGTLTDGGKITRAKMFYDTSRHTPGFVVGTDYVAIDEVKLVTFNDINEMRSIMQGYMERGCFNIGGYEGESSAGIVLLGNIAIENMDEYKSMFSELPSLFQESALVDRIHGFIKGWDIPKMSDDLKVSGWALNTEYFCTVMHMLRDDASYRAIVDELVDVSDNAYVRHTEAVKRIATAYLKLLFPNVRSSADVDIRQFNRYCLRPAVEMRKIIWRQLSILDQEYKNDDKQMPTFNVREPKI
jgi:ATP-dependent Lon protease